MNLTFIDMYGEFTKHIDSLFQGSVKTVMSKVELYKSDSFKVWVSPANSLCFMDGGIDLPLSTMIMPGIEDKLKDIVKRIGIKTYIDRPYLPIGSALYIPYDRNNALVSAPTMWLPQDVKGTDICYYTFYAVLRAIDTIDLPDNHEIVVPGMCCGYGKVPPEESAKQIYRAYNDYINKISRVDPFHEEKGIFLCEPNASQQSDNYMNKEWHNLFKKDKHKSS
jgi:O-acetyl-ADP-ribose deacetylase (regulator of RNase III)